MSDTNETAASMPAPNPSFGGGTVDELRAVALCDDPRNPGSTAAAVLWLAAEVRELRHGLTGRATEECGECGYAVCVPQCSQWTGAST